MRISRSKSVPTIDELFLFSRLWFDFVIGCVVDVNLVLCNIWCIKLRSLAPVVAARICKHVSLDIKGSTRNRLSDSPKGLESLLVVLVPKGHDTVGSNSRKGPVGVLKGNVIHGINIAPASVTLEGKVVLVANLLDILYANAALQTANGKARLVGKTADATCLVFEWRFLSLMLDGLGSTDIVNNHVTAGRPHHH